ncbi:Hypothetical protein R9X50_00629700 [Acrodontium crateriforme]|uniref:non-specific serine/threonine protein kinase n=1 Tax=Acrodontium crateriforme TaxID=150365 RepID=A0AAQ3M7N8_9PEZI|nr:Hypothetical protein R9X50_00629700 [Acrodontium crateriforme]
MDAIADWAEKRFRRRSRGLSLSKGLYEHTSLLNIDEPFEEETLPGYKPNNYYPVQVGQPLNARYKVLGKLDYNPFSTTWFCLDKKIKRYVEVKVCIALPANGSKKCRSNSEWNAYTHLSGMVTENEGFSFLRQILDRFTVVSAIGAEHQCFVYSPVGIDLAQFQRLAPNADLNLLKDILRAVLQALDFLHQDARIMHTNVNPETILFTITHKPTLALFAKRLQAHPPLGKPSTPSNRIIYQTTRLTHLLDIHEISLSKPVLADLGSARIMHKDDTQLLPRDIQPDPSLSPEMCLGMCWSFTTDIWALASISWLLFARTRLFDPINTSADVSGNWDMKAYITQVAALIGPPPAHISRICPVEFSRPDTRLNERKLNETGFNETRLNATGLNETGLNETRLNGTGLNKTRLNETGLTETGLVVNSKSILRNNPNDQTEFLAFMHAMLKWDPDERCSASELLDHAFLDQRTRWG